MTNQSFLSSLQSAIARIRVQEESLQNKNQFSFISDRKNRSAQRITSSSKVWRSMTWNHQGLQCKIESTFKITHSYEKRTDEVEKSRTAIGNIHASYFLTYELIIDSQLSVHHLVSGPSDLTSESIQIQIESSSSPSCGDTTWQKLTGLVQPLARKNMHDSCITHRQSCHPGKIESNAQTHACKTILGSASLQKLLLQRNTKDRQHYRILSLKAIRKMWNFGSA